MVKKAKLGVSALLIIGICFTAIGAIFTALGIIFAAVLQMDGSWLFGLIYGGIGSIFLILGIIFLCVIAYQQKRANALLAQGYYIWGEIAGFRYNCNLHVNGRNPFTIMVRHVDGSGITHMFKRSSLKLFPDPTLIGKRVKVYVERGSFKHYYVDLDDIFGQYVEH